MIENWEMAKEQSFKRIFLPDLKISILPVLPGLVEKISDWVKHDYQPYFEDEIPMPYQDENSPTKDDIETITKYIPTREMSFKIGNIEINVNNGKEKGYNKNTSRSYSMIRDNSYRFSRTLFN